MSGINYEDLELRALAHTAYQYGPRMKSVSVDRDAMRELSRRQAAHTVAEDVFDHDALELAVAQSFGLRHAEVSADLQRLANAQPWDPAPPLRMGPQRCLSSRETIERLMLALRPVPELEVSEDSPAHWRDIFARDFPEAARYFPQRPEPRTVWMGGDYIDDGTGRPPTKEEALQRFKEMLEAVRQAPVVGAYYPPHTRDTKPRG